MTGIAVAVLPDAGAPQVGITVTGLHASTSSTVTIEVSWNAGASWRPVRGAQARSVTGSMFIRDHVPPLNLLTTYRLTVTGPTIPDTLQATITVPSEHSWIQDPLAPHNAVPIDGHRTATAVMLLNASTAQLVRRQSADAVTVEGATYPVASVGPRQAPSNVPLALRALPRAQVELVDALRTLLASTGILVLRGLPPEVPIDPVADVILGDVTEVPVVGGLLGLRNDWELSATVVRPTSAAIVVPWWTYVSVLALWTPKTYDQAKATRPGQTYLDWVRDPRPV